MKITLLLMFIFSGGLLMALSIPMIQRRVKPNWWYGFRTPKTLSNPDLWYEVNAYSGRGLFISGVITIVGAIALYPIKLSEDAYASLCGVVIIIPVLGGFILSWWKYLR